MNLEELRTVRRTERQKDTLQHLRDSFYRDVAAYIENLKDQRKQAAERADDPFGDPEVGRLSDEIETAEEVVESLYERRVGKVVKLATFAAADMGGDEGGLTDEERDLYDDLVARIRENREAVLETLDGAEASSDGTAEADDETTETNAPDAAAVPPDTPDPVADAGADDVLAEAMGHDDSTAGAEAEADAPADVSADPSAPTNGSADGRQDAPSGSPPAAPPTASATGDTAVAEAPASATDGADERTGTTGAVSSETADSEAARVDDGTASENADRTTVRITRDVGEIFGVDERSYDLEREDVVTLPADNAEPLLRKDAAERLD